MAYQPPAQAKKANGQFLTDIEVVYYDEKPDKTNNFIQEIDGVGCDINEGCGGKYTYLFPKWGGEEDALCGVGFAKFKEAQGGSDLAKGAGGDYRYLQFRKNGKDGITSIFLWRTHKDIHQSNPGKRGYEYGPDINSGREGGGHLYLCWKTCAIDADIVVEEFRKGSWNTNMARTLEFVNTKLKNKGQLIDIALTMSNTDWLACIHIYYYRNVDIMQKYGRSAKTYDNHGNLLCAWKRYKSSWGSAAKEAVDSIQDICKTPNKLFGVKHACGNHAHTHGGATIFILYWDGVRNEGEGTMKGKGYETKQEYQ